MELFIDKVDERPIKVEQAVKVEADPRQLRLGLATISIRQPASAASTSSEEAGPSGTAYRTQALRRIPSSELGPADPPKGRGPPKGSKSRPRIPITFGLATPPERAASVRARESLAKMMPTKQV